MVADEPSIFDAKPDAIGARLLGEPTLEFIANSTQAPGIVFLVADSDVRPRPVKTAMVVVILGEIVGQHLAVKPVKRMKIIGSAAGVRRVGTGHRAEMIDKYRSIPFPKAQRFVADHLESEAGRRGRRGLRFRILRRRGGNGSQCCKTERKREACHVSSFANRLANTVPFGQSASRTAGAMTPARSVMTLYCSGRR